MQSLRDIIYSPSNYRMTMKRAQRGVGSLKVIGCGTIWHRGYDFLFDFHSNCGCRPSTHRLHGIRLQTVGWSWNWGLDHSCRSSKVAPFDGLCMVFYLTFIATMAVAYLAPFPRYPVYWLMVKIAQFSHPLIFGALVRGEAVGVKQRPSVTKK